MKFVAGIFQLMSFCRCHYSSVVEHVIGNDGVASPILANGTIYDKHLLRCFFCMYSKLFRESDFIDFEIGNFQQFIGFFYKKLISLHFNKTIFF